MTPEQHLVADIGGFAYDPLGFVRYAYPWGQKGELEKEQGPREWQADILREIGAKLKAGYDIDAVLMPVLIAVASGHGIGKSALISWVAHWAVSTCEDCRVVVTANTEDQLRTKTFSEMGKWFRLAINSHWWKPAAMSFVSALKAHEKTWRVDAVTWSENNLEAFAGLHNKGKRIVMVFDEASGIANKVSETAAGVLTDEDTEIVWLKFGNPTQPSGDFFECFNKFRGMWNPRQIDARTVPGTNKALFNEWANVYGEDSDFFRVRVRGEFPRAGSTQFISSEVAEAAVKRDVGALPTDPLIIGVDVARFGDDQSVLCFRKGRDARFLPWEKYRGLDTMQLAARVADAATRLKADMVFVDGGGVGGGVIDRLRQLNMRVTEVQFGAKADRAPIGDPAESQVAYANKRAEMWGQMREWLVRGGIPDDRELLADLSGVQYGFSAQNAIQLERKEDMKKRGFASPDAADALALTFAYPVEPSGMAAMFGTGARVVTEYDPYG